MTDKLTPTDAELFEVIREAARGGAVRRDGSTSLRIARAVLAKWGTPALVGVEPVALLVRKNSWRDGQWEAAPPNSPSYGLAWANQRVYVYTIPQPPSRARADGFFLPLPQRPKPEAPAGAAGLDWGAYSGAQMLAFGRECSDAAIAALRTQQPAPAGATEEVENLRKALVYVAFALHDTPQYMLAQGIALIDGDTVRVSRDGWTVEASVNPHRQPAQPDQPIACSYGDNGYACCEGGPCQADVHNDKLEEQQAPATAHAAECVPAPAPPPECETEAEKRAFAFGWFKALESERMKAYNKKKDPL